MNKLLLLTTLVSFLSIGLLANDKKEAAPAKKDTAPAKDAMPAKKDTAPRKDAMPAKKDAAPRKDAMPAKKDTAPEPVKKK
jgi:hypothetical protein